MVNTGMNHPNGNTPPRMAQRIIAVLMPEELRAAVLGDLEEEFVRRHAASSRQAAAWYWRQTLASIPAITVQHLRTHGASMLMWMVFAAAAMTGVSLWDSWVAQKAAWNLAAMTSIDDIQLIRTLYIFLQAMGFYIAGAFISRTAIRVQTHQLCVAVAVCLPLSVTVIQALNTDLQTFRLLQMLLCMLAVASGLLIHKPRRGQVR